MKKRLLIVGLLLAGFGFAKADDKVSVYQPRIPILIDRNDNILFQLRVEGEASDTFNGLRFSFDPSTDLSAIDSVKLYYAGTDDLSHQTQTRQRYAPVSYIARDQPGKTRAANPSYSVALSARQVTSRQVELSANQPLYPGVNYLWVSIRMKPAANLSSTLQVSLGEVMLSDQNAAFQAQTPSVTRRLGIGVRHAGDDGSAAYRIPGLVTTNKGTLLGVYDIRYNSSTDLQEYIDIGVSRSTDGGQSWEPMRTAMSFGEHNGLPRAQNGVGDPAILVDRKTNAVWVIAAWTQGMGNGRAWFNSQPGMDGTRTAQLMLVKSEDDGRTWSRPVNITEQVKRPEWHFLLQGPGMGITMQDGTLVFAAQYIDAEKIPNACIIYSKDRGATWHLHAPARSNTTEAQVAEVEPGLLMLNMRDNRGGSRAVSTTRDLGRTWVEHPSNRSVLQESVCMASLLHTPAKENVLGRDILLFSNPNTTKGRHHITIKASLDGGLTFPESYQVMLDEGEGWGYSCLTMIDRETVGILYEGSTAHMVFQAVKLKEIIKQ